MSLSTTVLEDLYYHRNQCSHCFVWIDWLYLLGVREFPSIDPAMYPSVPVMLVPMLILNHKSLNR
jgi:hypothetical protein